MQTAKELGMEVVDYSLMPEDCWYAYNPIAMLIIKKTDLAQRNRDIYVCPVTGAPLEDMGDVFFSQESLLAYPKVDGIPMLLESSGIVATKLMDFR